MATKPLLRGWHYESPVRKSLPGAALSVNQYADIRLRDQRAFVQAVAASAGYG